MRIDATIYQAIDAGTLSIEEVLASMMQFVLEEVELSCLAKGFAPADVKLEIERLRKTQPAQLETVRQMLESRAPALQ